MTMHQYFDSPEIILSVVHTTFLNYCISKIIYHLLLNRVYICLKKTENLNV